MPTLTNWSEKQIKIFVQILNLEKAKSKDYQYEEKKSKLAHCSANFG